MWWGVDDGGVGNAACLPVAFGKVHVCTRFFHHAWHYIIPWLCALPLCRLWVTFRSAEGRVRAAAASIHIDAVPLLELNWTAAEGGLSERALKAFFWSIGKMQVCRLWSSCLCCVGSAHMCLTCVVSCVYYAGALGCALLCYHTNFQGWPVFELCLCMRAAGHTR